MIVFIRRIQAGMIRVGPVTSACRMAFALAVVSPMLLAAAPEPAKSAMPTGTFTFATAGRVALLPNAAGYTLAPTPNTSLSAPQPLNANSKAPEWSPSLFRPKRTYRGEGFIDGSTAQDQQQRRLAPAPGINLNVPLD